jgi:hypothetical protein
METYRTTPFLVNNHLSSNAQKQGVSGILLILFYYFEARRKAIIECKLHLERYGPAEKRTMLLCAFEGKLFCARFIASNIDVLRRLVGLTFRSFAPCLSASRACSKITLVRRVVKLRRAYATRRRVNRRDLRASHSGTPGRSILVSPTLYAAVQVPAGRSTRIRHSRRRAG